MTTKDLIEMQSWSLDRKIRVTQTRIIEWFQHYGGKVYVSFSGGKDSTVLLDLARRCYPDIATVFIDTGLEYPQIKEFVKSIPNVTVIRPKMTFRQVIEKYGYPLISKEVANIIRGARGYKKGENKSYLRYCKVYDFNSIKDKYTNRYNATKWKALADSNIPISEQCCDVMKKKPAKDYEQKTGNHPLIATMASESLLRQTQWLENGCNAFNKTRPTSQPMSFWTEQDVLEYLTIVKPPYAKSVYGEIVKSDSGKFYTTGCSRTGCVFCGFGCHLEKSPTRFQQLQKNNPRLYDYCLKGGAFDENGIWKPTNEGLGLKYIFEELNSLYGEEFIKYENPID